ncbi:hypothetical protein BofuT4_uP075470.1 [Botrytis cinerea T4]|uniref:Uncharacterized protein n=1 Tax=Botryotinia fuckeliana (strain T4) TaxID=999810 RepID=G2XNK8_BOTF4|nr:hypothetical protein BofuT4_uP075470.1 [Botrytis cinerea T4]
MSEYGRHFNRGGTGREGTHLAHISTSQMERRDAGTLKTHWGGRKMRFDDSSW